MLTDLDQEVLKKCAGCGKPIEKSEWIRSISNKSIRKHLEEKFDFKCSKCGHEMYCGVFKPLEEIVR